MRFISSAFELTTAFKQFYMQYAHFSCLTAWAGQPGFEAEKSISDNTDKIDKMVVGLHFYQTSPEFIEKYFRKSNIRYINKTDDLYHSKLYLFYNSENDWALIMGSSNFTNGGFESNIESNILIKSTDGKATLFSDVSKLIDECWEKAIKMTPELLETYKSQCKKYQPKSVSLITSTKETKIRDVSSFENMGWEEYMNRMKNNAKLGSNNEYIRQRLYVLRESHKIFEHVERTGGSFAKLDLETRQKIAGFPRKELYEKEHADWAWFGSTKPNGNFKKEINNGTEVAAAIDLIPIEGEISKAKYNAFCEAFMGKKFVNPIALMSRLLAMKRPDKFLCVDSANRGNLSKEITKLNNLNSDTYWDFHEKHIWNAFWFKEKPKTEDSFELEMKKYQVAMLDVFFYKFE